MSAPRPNAWPAIKNHVKQMAQSIMALPTSRVWLHEKVLYQIINAPQGQTFSQRTSLSCVIKGLKKGFCGDRKRGDYMALGYCVDLAEEDNLYGVAYQIFGASELFSSGTLLDDTTAIPRWFISGSPVMDLRVQNSIVSELVGESDVLPDSVNNRRSQNYMAFLRDDKNDGGFSRSDVPTVVFKFHAKLKSYVTSIDHTFCTNSSVSSRAFIPSELERVKDLFRLMIVASNKGGKLRIAHYKFVIASSSRESRPTTIQTPANVYQLSELNQQSTDNITPLSRPRPTNLFSSHPRRRISTGSITDTPTDALKLQAIDVVSPSGGIHFNKISNLASLELVFHLHCNGMSSSEIIAEMTRLSVSPPTHFELSLLESLSSATINNVISNIRTARARLETSLDGYFVPEKLELLYDWCKSAVDEVVHWWRQFGLNSEAVSDDLQRLSRENKVRVVSGSESPLTAFKRDYSVLFECLEAVFALFPSNSRLSEQIHGDLRGNLRSGTGMDEVDAQRNYTTSTEYNFRKRRRDSVLENQPQKKRMRSVDHNKNKTQLAMIGQQITEYVMPWVERASTLLSRPQEETGIPAISEINREGRRKQDKANLDEEFKAEKAKSARLTRQVVTVAQVQKDACEAELSNDRVLRLDDSRLEARIKIVQYTVAKFWKSELKIPIPEGASFVQYTIRTAWKTFPHWHNIVYRAPKATPVKLKGEMMKLISKYLSRIKITSTLILHFLFGKPGDKKSVPKRDRDIDGSDILETFKFVRLGIDEAEAEEICEPAVMTALLSFHKSDEHYTYTKDKDESNDEENEIIEDEDSGSSSDESVSNETDDENEDSLHFIDI